MTKEQTEKIKWLRRAKKANDSARDWLSLLEHDREQARISSNSFSDSGTYGNNSVNSKENVLINLAETERRTQKKCAEYVHICDEIASAIEEIEDEDLQAVLTWHYLKFLTWEETAYRMNYSVSAVKKKHKKALDKLYTKVS